MEQRASFRCLTVASLAIALLVACTSPKERFAEHVARAERLKEEGDVEAAILEYRSALKIDPESPSANEHLAELLLSRGDNNATYYLEEAYRLAPERIDLGTRVVSLLLLSARTKQAEAIVGKMLESHPESAAIHSLLSEVLLHRNDVDQALAAATKATELDPDDPAAWLQLGRVHEGRIRMADRKRERIGNEVFKAAIAAFERADKLKGGFVAAQVQRAGLLGARPKTRRKAGAAFMAAVELAAKQGDTDQQFAAAEAAERFAARTNNAFLRGWALRQLVTARNDRLDYWEQLGRISESQPDKGLSIYTDLLEQRPDDPRAHMLFANHLVRNGKAGAAVKHLREVIAGGLDSPLLWEHLIRLQLGRRRLANARATFVRMSDKFPDDPITRRVEARIALTESRPQDAARILRALTSDSGDPETQRLLALAELRLGNLADAAAAIDRGLAHSSQFFPDLIRLKAAVHHASGEWALALRTFALLKARGINLTNAEMLMLAQCLYEAGQQQRGRGVLEKLLAEKAPPGRAAIEYAKREGRGHPEEAVTHLEAALDRQPANLEILKALVGLDLRSGRSKEALTRLNAVVDSGQMGAEALLLRANVLVTANDPKRAEADAVRAFEADPSLPDAVDLLYWIYSREGRLEEAQRSFEEAESAGVLHPAGRVLLSRILFQRGETGRARALLEEVLRDNAGMARAKSELAFVLAASNQDLDRALRLAEEAQRSMSTDPRVVDSVGYVYLRKGLHEAALQQFQSAIALDDGSIGGRGATLQYHLGLALRALGRNDEAASALEKALEIDADFPDAEDARHQLEEAQRPMTPAVSPS